jgi:imidazolonepropionase-like amidohydrolase
VWRLQERAKQGPLTAAEQARLDQVLLGHEKTMEFCGRMISMGLKVIAGSDSSWGDYQLGGFVHEVHILAEAGMSNTKAILAGTRDSAASIGVGDIVGTLEPGKEADVLVVNGDPSAKVNALWNVVALFQGGIQAVGR